MGWRGGTQRRSPILRRSVGGVYSVTVEWSGIVQRRMYLLPAWSVRLVVTMVQTTRFIACHVNSSAGKNDDFFRFYEEE
ncbi:unnamed protein product [Protopolystoma xenopodis]|uniref:Uncharacterized protein n=1 Tax=Protopolystoma xenopodis TaxID=117903 RepID=A0A448XIX1_9PLAT|nr:unnamed protein product [Protopolystoma xenopodis]